MKILAIDTSGDLLSVALQMDDQVYCKEQCAVRNHNQSVLILIDKLMKTHAVEFAALDGVAFGQGPGSFTGLRIAAAVAQGIAFGAQVPVVPVSCLAAIAEKQEHDKVLVAMDAKREKVYWGSYVHSSNGMMQLDGEERLSPIADLSTPSGDWQGAGSGWDCFATEILALDRVSVRSWTAGQVPHAVEIAKRGAIELSRGSGQDACLAIPNYQSPYFVSPT